MQKRHLVQLVLLAVILLFMTFCSEQFKSIFIPKSTLPTQESTPTPEPSPTNTSAVEVDRRMLEDLKAKVDGGDPLALKDLCPFVVGKDLYNLNGFEISDELQATCAEMRPSPMDHETN